MKQIKYILFVLSVVCALFSISCTESITLQLPPKTDCIVFNANISLSGNAQEDSTQVFTLSYVADATDPSPAPVVGAVITVSDDLQHTFIFQEEQAGEYVCHHFFHSTSNNYTMTANYENEDYTASEVLLPTPTLDSAIIRSRSDETQMKATEINLYMTDIPNESNAYELRYVVNHQVVNPNTWGVFDDRYKDGKVLELTVVAEDKDAHPGDTLNFVLNSISITNFYFLYTMNTQSNQTNSLAPAPAPIRGNIINTTRADHYPMGYFRINNRSTLDVLYPLK